MYKFGQGAPENHKTAVKWYTLAAKQGYANAQDNLGAVYKYRGGLYRLPTCVYVVQLK
jgi:TPR repeat protein